MDKDILVLLLIKDFINGLKDSFAIIPALRKIDATSKSRQNNNRLPQADDQTSLAKRRIEKPKNQHIDKPVNIIQKKETVQDRLTKCCILNGGFCLACFLFFQYLIQPSFEWLYYFFTGSKEVMVWSGVLKVISSFYFVPMLLISRTTNLISFQDIGEAAFRRVMGRPQTSGLGVLVADLTFSFFVQSLFLIQAQLLSWLVLLSVRVEAVSEAVYLFHLTLLHSLYAFEYKWYYLGWSAEQRVSHLEQHWSYFMGFGLPLTSLIYLTSYSYYFSSFLFGFLFPILIVSSNEANNKPLQINLRLRIFSPVSQISNFIFKKIVKDGYKYYELFVKFSTAVLKLTIIVCCYASIPLAAVAKVALKSLSYALNLYQSHRKSFLVLFIIIVFLFSFRLIMYLFHSQVEQLVNMLTNTSFSNIF